MLPIIQLAFFLIQVTNATPTPTVTSFDPRSAALAAIQKLDASNKDNVRFTFHRREHASSYDPGGRQFFDDVRTYEVTWLNDREYWRLLEVGDKPLDEKNAADEQKLYEKAFLKKKDLGGEKQRERNGEETITMDSNLDLLLNPAYIFTEKSQINSDFGLVHIVEATLPSGAKAKSRCRWHYKLWISEKDGILRKYDADVPDAKSPECSNARDIATYTVVGGVPKLSKWALRFMPYPETGVTAVDDYTFTDYQIFDTSDSIGPAAVVKARTTSSDTPPTPASDAPK